MRILLSAFACDPLEGSEPGVGWAWAYHLAQAGHDVSVLTRKDHRTAIEDKLAELALPNLRFEYVEVRHLPFWMPGLGVYPYYICWQWKAYFCARKLHGKHRFDVVHHVTYGGFRNPSYLYLLGAPFIFGPVGGGERAPIALRAGMPVRAKCYEAMRDLVNLLPRLDPFWRSMLRCSARLAVKTGETCACLPRKIRGKAHIALENMVAYQPYLAGEADRKPPLKLLFAGQLRALKGLHLAVRAMAQVVPQAAVQLVIVGKGEEESRLKDEVRKLELQESIRFLPWVSRSEVLALHATHDALLFPSLHDSSGTVVMEAIAHGKPVICLDLGGPAVTVDRDCARIVDTHKKTEEEVVQGLANAILELARMGDDAWRQMRGAAVKRALSYTPQQVIACVYGPLIAKETKQQSHASDGI